MKRFKLATNGVIRDDGAFIPEDSRNRHWRQYEAWKEQGNTPDPADPEPASQPEPTEDLIQAIRSANTLQELKQALTGTGPGSPRIQGGRS
jgi:hypothetical protein